MQPPIRKPFSPEQRTRPGPRRQSAAGIWSRPFDAVGPRAREPQKSRRWPPPRRDSRQSGTEASSCSLLPPVFPGVRAPASTGTSKGPTGSFQWLEPLLKATEETAESALFQNALSSLRDTLLYALLTN
ncbi:uncharacterized protein LOC119378835 [Rhipicephalus sanguineus]|uniref:uncharacterized protein LOC119378835 n=1 Tax=Rhipicephalus sanguineus TaxID=34632 RepID=UPI00189603DA|nr:uncharacterized protein LOC119378835 [Rhipicephalus sanguineus]